jgi:histidinol-phosphate aminotransferase
MLSRRDLARRFGVVAASIAIGGEAAFAQRSGVHPKDRSQLVLLNANENPEGPPQISIDAMTKALPRGGRYHDEDTESLTSAIAASEHLQAEQVLAASGSSEILHCAVDAFTSPTLPLITTLPSYEQPVEIAAAHGNPVIKVPMTPEWAADVRKMVAEAEKARGGFIYVVNPNNPTSSITKKADIAWLVANLPPNTVALIDEAYIHFSTSPELASSIPYVQQGKNVIVARTFSKIYGMAGLRIGFGCARPDLIRKMSVYRNNIVPVPSVQAAKVALASPTLVPERREKFVKIRSEVCNWLDANRYKFIPPHGNFLMIDVKRDVRGVIAEMLDRGVAVGRPFPPLNQMLRVTIGTDADMAKFREVFPQVVKA